MAKQPDQLRNRLDESQLPELAYYKLKPKHEPPVIKKGHCARCSIHICNCDNCKAWLDIYKEEVPHMCVDI